MSEEKRGEVMETIDDIVREMRTLGRLDEKSTDKIPRSLQALGLRTYADRIEAAYSRLPILTPEQWTQIAQQAAEMSDLKRENERLRVALIPVLEVDCQLDNYPTKEAYMAALEIVVSDAQRIYNEGDEHI